MFVHQSCCKELKAFHFSLRKELTADQQNSCKEPNACLSELLQGTQGCHLSLCEETNVSKSELSQASQGCSSELLRGAYTDLSKARLSGSAAAAGMQGGVQAPDPDMPPCVGHYDVTLLGITAHAVDAVQPIHCCSDGAQQRWAGTHLPHPHAAIACASCHCSAFCGSLCTSVVHLHLSLTMYQSEKHAMHLPGI